MPTCKHLREVPSFVISATTIPSMIRSTAARAGVQSADAEKFLQLLRGALGYELEETHLFVLWHVSSSFVLLSTIGCAALPQGACWV